MTYPCRATSLVGSALLFVGSFILSFSLSPSPPLFILHFSVPSFSVFYCWQQFFTSRTIQLSTCSLLNSREPDKGLLFCCVHQRSFFRQLRQAQEYLKGIDIRGSHFVFSAPTHAFLLLQQTDSSRFCPNDSSSKRPLRVSFPKPRPGEDPKTFSCTVLLAAVWRIVVVVVVVVNLSWV